MSTALESGCCSTTGSPKTAATDPMIFCAERVGEDIKDRYEFGDKQVGCGAFGTVYKGKDKKSGRTVAIKRLNLVTDRRDAFMQETSIMKGLDHPHICKLLETYEGGRHMFLVLECCEGGEVLEKLLEQHVYSEHQTADIITQSAGALKYAHSKGVAHRDLKPENILFYNRNPDCNDIAIIDWGLARYFENARMTSSVGSETYAAPEVVEARPNKGYNALCDVWSLGVVAYVMLSATPPFWGGNMFKKMKQESYPLDDGKWPSVSREAKDFIAKALKYTPSNRMTVDQCLQHPWLRLQVKAHDPVVSKQLLLNMSNMRGLVKSPRFFAIFIASVARQLDHNALCGIRKVFREIDANNDGVLDLSEMRLAFERYFGPDSTEFKEVDAIFASSDLDGSGTIAFTEFAAACIGSDESMRDEAIHSAFKQFDTQENDGRLSREEIKEAFAKSDINKAWSNDELNAVVQDIFSTYDTDGNNELDIQEFKHIMRDCVKGKCVKSHEPHAGGNSASLPEALASKSNAANTGSIAPLLSTDGLAVTTPGSPILAPPRKCATLTISCGNGLSECGRGLSECAIM